MSQTRAAAGRAFSSGADVVIAYLNEHEDARETVRAVEQYGRKCLSMAADLRELAENERVVAETLKQFDKVSVLVNNIAVQFPQERLEDISVEQLENTYRTNIFPFFHMTKAALPHLE